MVPVWRPEPKPLREYTLALLAAGGAGFGLIGLQAVAIASPILLKTLLAFFGIFVSQFGLTFLITRREQVLQRLVMAPLEGMEFGPKHLVKVEIGKGKTKLGTDTGILRLDGGQLRYDGLRTDFAIPKDRLRESEYEGQTPGVRVTVDVEGQEIWLAFREQRRIEPTPSFMNLSYAFGNLWITEPAGAFTPPPTSPSPKSTRRETWEMIRVPLFWLLLVLLCSAEAYVLQTQKLREAGALLAVTFALTAIAGGVPPVLRARRIYLSVKEPSILEVPTREGIAG